MAEITELYNGQKYRFEVAPDDLEDVREFLADHGSGRVVVDAVEEFVVVVRTYTDHPDNIFRDSVSTRSADGYNGFLMTDQAAVEEAVHEGGGPTHRDRSRKPVLSGLNRGRDD